MRIAGLIFVLFLMPQALGCHVHHTGKGKVIVPPVKVKPLPPGKVKKLGFEDGSGSVFALERSEI